MVDRLLIAFNGKVVHGFRKDLPKASSRKQGFTGKEMDILQKGIKQCFSEFEAGKIMGDEIDLALLLAVRGNYKREVVFEGNNLYTHVLVSVTEEGCKRLAKGSNYGHRLACALEETQRNFDQLNAQPEPHDVTGVKGLHIVGVLPAVLDVTQKRRTFVICPQKHSTENFTIQPR